MAKMLTTTAKEVKENQRKKKRKMPRIHRVRQGRFYFEHHHLKFL
jgi:hypothetical protein